MRMPGYAPEKLHRRRVLIRLLIALPSLALAIAGGSLLTLYCLVHYTLYRDLSPEGHRLFHNVMQERRQIPPAWRDPKPFRVETLAAYQEYLDQKDDQTTSQGQYCCDCETVCWQAKEAEADFVTSGILTYAGKTSVSVCMKYAGQRLEKLRQLIAMPDFDPDIESVPPPFIGNRRSGPSLSGDILNKLRAYYMDAALSDVSKATSEGLCDYEALRLADSKGIFSKWTCPGGMINSLRFIPATVRWKGDRELAVSMLARLEILPPESQIERIGDTEAQVYGWTAGFYILILRELKRIGYPVNLSRPMNGGDIYRVTQLALEDYPRWAGKRYPGNPGLAEIKDYGYPQDICLPPNPVIRYLYLREWGPWSTYAKEWHMIWLNNWRFEHTFPVGNSVAASLAIPAVDMCRVRYDLARMNLAAFIYHADNGDWPVKPADLVPRYLPRIPPDPGARGPFTWSGVTHEFLIRSSPNENVGII